MKPKQNNAIIDIGSNSTRMLIFRKNKDGKLFQVARSIEYTQLAENLTSSGIISKDAILRTVQTLENYKKIAKDYGVKKIYAFATAAMREAKNSQEILDLIKEKLDITVHIISGETESLYGFYGVSQTQSGELLIFDIGGSSTELIYGNREIFKAESLKLGCIRQTEIYFKNQDFIDKNEIKRMFETTYELISKELENFNLDDNFSLIGIGGTITTLVCILENLDIYDSTIVHNHVLTFTQIKEILTKLASLNYEERLKVKGLPQKRANSIIAGTVIVLAILKACKKTRCKVCDFDNLEGAAYLKFMVGDPNKLKN